MKDFVLNPESARYFPSGTSGSLCWCRTPFWGKEALELFPCRLHSTAVCLGTRQEHKKPVSTRFVRRDTALFQGTVAAVGSIWKCVFLWGFPLFLLSLQAEWGGFYSLTRCCSSGQRPYTVCVCSCVAGNYYSFLCKCFPKEKILKDRVFLGSPATSLQEYVCSLGDFGTYPGKFVSR